MSKIVWCHTTEEHIWISLPFRIRETGLSKRAARIIAVRFRRKGHLARTLRRADGWLVASFRPRKIEPAPWQLIP